MFVRFLFYCDTLLSLVSCDEFTRHAIPEFLSVSYLSPLPLITLLCLYYLSLPLIFIRVRFSVQFPGVILFPDLLPLVSWALSEFCSLNLFFDLVFCSVSCSI